MKSKKVVIVIPAYNEAAVIGSVIKDIKARYGEGKNSEYCATVLVVNDGSNDDTARVAREAGAERVLSHQKHLGPDAATKSGMQAACGMGADIAVRLDADFYHDLESIDAVARPLLCDEADICWGSRFKGERRYRMPVLRLWGNHFFNWLINKLTPYQVSDAHTGLMAFNRTYLEIFEIFGSYSAPQQILIDASRKDMRYTEVPVTFHPPVQKKSFAYFVQYPFKAFAGICLVLTYANPVKVFGGIGLLFIAAAFVWVLLFVIGRIGQFSYVEQFPNFVGLLLFLGGLHILSFGIIVDLIMRKKKR